MSKLINKVGPLRVAFPFTHNDKRGFIFQTFNCSETLFPRDSAIQWQQENILVEHKYALRGIHVHTRSWVLATCVYGSIRLAVVSADKREKYIFDFDAPSDRPYQVLIPPGYGNGHCVLSEVAVFHYLWSELYENDPQRQIKWNDPKLSIDWGLGIYAPILSERDK